MNKRVPAKGIPMSDIPKLEVATHESYKDGSKHIGRIVDCAECMDGNEVEIEVTANSPVPLKLNNKVFISHGKNHEIVEQLKDLLRYVGFEPIVSIEGDSAAKPVPDKVMDDMRECAAGIVHVGAEKKLLDENGTECNVLNENVVIEIGAAMALYGRKYILLVQDGMELPSNLQGLYQVRYQGDALDYQATMKLLKAFADFRDAKEK